MEITVVLFVQAFCEFKFFSKFDLMDKIVKVEPEIICNCAQPSVMSGLSGNRKIEIPLIRILSLVGVTGCLRVQIVEFFLSNTILTFLYKIDIEGVSKSAKIKLPPLGIELTTSTIYGLEF